MSEFNFKSQICTNRFQSERLLALGLKKETADMRWERISEKYAYYPSTKTPYVSSDIPAWSLHRLLMLLTTSKRKVMLIRWDLDIYDFLIRRIEYAIKEGYFNKEYLEE